MYHQLVIERLRQPGEIYVRSHRISLRCCYGTLVRVDLHCHQRNSSEYGMHTSTPHRVLTYRRITACTEHSPALQLSTLWSHAVKIGPDTNWNRIPWCITYCEWLASSYSIVQETRRRDRRMMTTVDRDMNEVSIRTENHAKAYHLFWCHPRVSRIILLEKSLDDLFSRSSASRVITLRSAHPPHTDICHCSNPFPDLHYPLHPFLPGPRLSQPHIRAGSPASSTPRMGRLRDLLPQSGRQWRDRLPIHRRWMQG
jgi:hypothetical protein